MGRLALRPGLRAYAHAPAAETEAPWVNEKSMSFDGTDDLFGTAAGGGLPDNGVSPYSVSLWLKLLATGSGTKTILGSNDPAQNVTRMGLTLNHFQRKLSLTIRGDSTGYSSTGSTVLTVGTWYHVCITDIGFLQASPAAMNVYVNGVSQLTWEGEDYSANHDQHLYLGGNKASNFSPGDENKFFDCGIDEVGVWRTQVLTPTEAALIYDGNGTRTAGPTDLEDTTGVTVPDSYWRMGDLDDTDGAGGTIKDRIGSYHMTAGSGNGSGAPAVSTSVP